METKTKPRMCDLITGHALEYNGDVTEMLKSGVMGIDGHKMK